MKIRRFVKSGLTLACKCVIFFFSQHVVDLVELSVHEAASPSDCDAHTQVLQGKN